MTEPGKQGAQVLKSLLVGGVRPEKEGELLPRDRSEAMQDEVSQQVLEARMFETSHRLITPTQAERTE